MPKYQPIDTKKYAIKTDKYEFPMREDSVSIIPQSVLNTNDVETIQNYLDEHEKDLSSDELQYLQNRIDVGAKLISLKEDAETKLDNDDYRKPVCALFGEPDSDRLELDFHQDTTQTTQNGCWSVVYSNLLKSRGIELTQQDIRAYRPFSTKEAEGVSWIETAEMNTDRQFSPMEMGDLALETVPNVVMREQSFTTDVSSIDKQQYLEDVCSHIKGQIRKSLDSHSPLGLMSASHYITVTGIDGDTIYYKDSDSDPANPDETYHASIKELVEPGLTMSGARGVSIVWLEDAQLSQDGKTLKGLPGHQFSVSENGGVTVNNPGDGTDVHQRKGLRSEQYVTLGEPTMNRRFQDVAYVPKQMNMRTLKPTPDRAPQLDGWTKFKGILSSWVGYHGPSYNRYQAYKENSTAWNNMQQARQSELRSRTDRPFNGRDWEVMADRMEESLYQLEKGIRLKSLSQFQLLNGEQYDQVPTTDELKATAAGIRQEIDALAEKLSGLSDTISPDLMQKYRSRLEAGTQKFNEKTNDLRRGKGGVSEITSADLNRKLQSGLTKSAGKKKHKSAAPTATTAQKQSAKDKGRSFSSNN